MGTTNVIIDSKLDEQTFTNDLESYWLPHSFGLDPHLSKKTSKFAMVSKLD